MHTAVSRSPPSVPVQLHDPNTPVAEPQHLEAPQRLGNSPHRDLDRSRTTEVSLCEEVSKRADNTSKHTKGDGESRVAALRQAIEVKEKDSKIIELKEQVSVEVLEAKNEEIMALKEEVERLEKAECDACKQHTEVDNGPRTLKGELEQFHHVKEKPGGDGATDAEITPLVHQPQQPKKPRHDEAKGGYEDDELKTLRAEVDRLRTTETNSKVAVDLLEQAAKELLFLRDEVAALRQRMGSSATADSCLMEEEEVSLRAEVMRLRQVEKNSQVAAAMLEEIMARSDAAADVLCEMMCRRPEVAAKEISSGVD